MVNKNNTKNNETSSLKDWCWFPCRLTLERVVDGSIVYWNTTPTTQLTINSGQGRQNECKYSIQMQKLFNYDSNLTWFWHKSWVLPQIIVQIDSKNSEKIRQDLINIEIKLFITKVCTIGTNMMLTDVGVLGQSTIKAKFGKNTFSQLKFNSTSFNHQNSKFNIVILVTRYSPNKLMNYEILTSFISPPIFVDSRRKIPDKIEQVLNLVTQKINYEFYSLFQPSSFNKLYFKKKNGSSNLIQSKLQDFINYFSAPNIRNKIRNPIFLIYRFFSNFIPYLNTGIVENCQQLMKQLFNKSIGLFLKTQTQNMSSHKPKPVFDKIFPKTILCIYVNSQSQDEISDFKKIIQKFDIGGQNQLVSFIFNDQLLTSRFKRLNDLEVVRYEYQQYYKNIKLIHKEKIDEQFEQQKVKQQQEIMQGNKQELEQEVKIMQQNTPPSNRKSAESPDYPQVQMINMAFPINYYPFQGTFIAFPNFY